MLKLHCELILHLVAKTVLFAHGQRQKYTAVRDT